MKYGFWYYQPVFHAYDFGYYFFPCGIIKHELPEANKYTDFKKVDTLLFHKLKKHEITEFAHFIQKNFLQNKDNVFLPKKENIIPYFVGHSSQCFFSFYKETEYLQDTKDNTLVETKKLLGVMTGRPLKVVINNKKDKNAFFDVYYVDYLCVDANHRKTGVAPIIIQTHEYNQRHLNKKIVVSLFKREGKLTGIVPLCVYNTYCFSIKKWGCPEKLPVEFTVLPITLQNLYLLTDYIKSETHRFDIYVFSEIANLSELIKTQNVFVYVVLKNNAILCAYFFRKTCIEIEHKMEALTCFASISSSQKDVFVFVQGYKNAFWEIVSKNKNFGYCVIENISDNDLIINNVVIKTAPMIISPTAYFFYNFAYSTFASKKVLIVS